MTINEMINRVMNTPIDLESLALSAGSAIITGVIVAIGIVIYVVWKVDKEFPLE